MFILVESDARTSWIDCNLASAMRVLCFQKLCFSSHLSCASNFASAAMVLCCEYVISPFLFVVLNGSLEDISAILGGGNLLRVSSDLLFTPSPTESNRPMQPFCDRVCFMIMYCYVMFMRYVARGFAGINI